MFENKNIREKRLLFYLTLPYSSRAVIGKFTKKYALILGIMLRFTSLSKVEVVLSYGSKLFEIIFYFQWV
jgi:hypothetical protein